MTPGRLARLLLVPALAGLVTTVIVYAAVGGRVDVPADLQTTGVVVVRASLPPRTQLKETDLAVRQVPVDLAEGAATSPVEVAGLMNAVPLVAGEILLRDKLVDPARAALPYRIPADRRAVTFQVDEYSAVAGYVESGERVDIVVVFPEKPNAQGGKTPAQARLILADVLVLELGPKGETAANDKGPSMPQARRGQTSVTLALTPEQAVQAALSERVGEIKLLLRPIKAEGDGRPVIDEGTLRSSLAR